MQASFSDRLLTRLADARRVAVLTGAGISAESGIPTFRDPDGLWQRFKPEELANVNAFLQNPRLVQEWYRHRRMVAEKCRPNPGHTALREMEGLYPEFTLITQNVDNLHQRAGSSRVIELHGNISRNYCIGCRRPVMDDELRDIREDKPTICPACGGLIRPDVVWFGEMLPIEAFTEAQKAAERADVFLSIGTSALVYPAAGLPLEARKHGAYVAEINIQPSSIADALDETVEGKAGEVLPRLVEEIRQVREKGIHR